MFTISLYVIKVDAFLLYSRFLRQGNPNESQILCLAEVAFYNRKCLLRLTSVHFLCLWVGFATFFVSAFGFQLQSVEQFARREKSPSFEFQRATVPALSSLFSAPTLRVFYSIYRLQMQRSELWNAMKVMFTQDLL